MPPGPRVPCASVRASQTVIKPPASSIIIAGQRLTGLTGLTPDASWNPWPCSAPCLWLSHDSETRLLPAPGTSAASRRGRRHSLPGQPHSAQYAHRNPQLPHPPSTGYRSTRLPSIPRSPRPSPGLFPTVRGTHPSFCYVIPHIARSHIRRPTRTHSTAISICDDAHPVIRTHVFCSKRSGVHSPCRLASALSVSFQVDFMNPGASRMPSLIGARRWSCASSVVRGARGRRAFVLSPSTLGHRRPQLKQLERSCHPAGCIHARAFSDAQ